MSISKQLIRILPLMFIVVGLLSYNFMSAQWQSPTSTAPYANTAAPINISANYQAKFGDLGAVRMRAGEYCDAAGSNCILQENLNHFIASTHVIKKTQSGIGKGQKVSVSCDGSPGDPDYGGESYDGGGVDGGVGSQTNFFMMTGGGCRVTGVYDELLTDEGDIFSYPINGVITGPNISDVVDHTWNCENKNLGTTTIEASVVCLYLNTAQFGGA